MLLFKICISKWSFRIRLLRYIHEKHNNYYLLLASGQIIKRADWIEGINSEKWCIADLPFADYNFLNNTIMTGILIWQQNYLEIVGGGRNYKFNLFFRLEAQRLLISTESFMRSRRTEYVPLFCFFIVPIWLMLIMNERWILINSCCGKSASHFFSVYVDDLQVCSGKNIFE
jgi:hypothetical protein